MHTANSDGGGSSGIVVVTATGGSAVFTILTLLCIVLLFVMWHYNKHSNNERKSAAEPNKSYDCMELGPGSENTVTTPSYGKTDNGGNAVKIDSTSKSLCQHSNLDVSDGAANLKKMMMMNNSYMEPDEASLSHHRKDIIKIDDHQSSVGQYRPSLSHSVIKYAKRTGENHCLHGSAQDHHRENTNKMEIDPIYQSTGGQIRTVEIYDAEREDHVVKVVHYKEETIEVEIDPAYQSNVRTRDSGAAEMCDIAKTGGEDQPCNYVESISEKDHRENTSKMEIDSIYQVTAGGDRSMEIYGIENIEMEISEGYDMGTYEVTYHEEDNIEVEIDPAYWSIAYQMESST